MELRTFCKGIDLPSGAEEKLFAMEVSEELYQKGKEMFWRDREAFYRWTGAMPNHRMLFLYFFCRLGCETYPRYQDKKIPDEVYWDTFRDISFWCVNCYDEFGEYGINQYDWFFRHIEMTVFRLGRLEFETMESEWDLCAGGQRVHRGEAVINMHIPQGEKLTQAACVESIEKGIEFFRDERPYICHSWLLYPGLKEILRPGSNILEFQKLFWLAEVDYLEREGEWRIFTKVRDEIEEYPENTSLQRAAKQYLLSGKKLGNGIGILKRPVRGDKAAGCCCE